MIEKPNHEGTSRLLEEAVSAFGKYIKLRDCLQSTDTTSFGRCITCNRRERRETLQAGHYPAGRGNSHIFSEVGTNAQCNVCNTHLGGRPKDYREELVRRHGEEEVQKLEREAKKPRRFTRDELIGIKTLYRKKYKELLDRQGVWT